MEVWELDGERRELRYICCPSQWYDQEGRYVSVEGGQYISDGHDSYDNSYRMALIWLCINLAPQLLFSIVSLSVTIRKDFWRVVSRYPPLLLCPVFTIFTFGSRQAACCGGRGERSLVLSKKMTMINIALTLLTNLAVFGLSEGIHDSHLIQFDPNNDSTNWDDTNYIPVYISCIIILPFLFSLLPLLLFYCCLLYTSPSPRD